MWRVVLPALVLAFAVPAGAAPQEDPPAAGSRIHRSVPTPGARTHLAIPGERFRAGAFRRWFYGDNYRDLWTTAIEFPVLDLDTVGGGTYFGFRKDPFASRHAFDIGLASRDLKPFASYEGVFRRLWSDVDLRLAIEYSGLVVTRFTGFGNDTRLEHPSSFYKVRQGTFLFAPALEFRAGAQDSDASAEGTDHHRSELAVSLGPVIKWSSTPLDDNSHSFIGSLDQTLYGTGSFGQIGARSAIRYDGRDSPAFPTRGFLARITASGYLGAWNAESAFGSVEGELRTYLAARVPTSPTLALGLGGKKVWGKYPFLESAFVGGPDRIGFNQEQGPVRGFRQNRFAGDASLHGTAELRLKLTSVNVVVPGEFGLFAAADVGRVYYGGDPDRADRWHRGTGGGFWLSFLERRTAFSLALMNGRDVTSVYLRGYMF